MCVSLIGVVPATLQEHAYVVRVGVALAGAISSRSASAPHVRHEPDEFLDGFDEMLIAAVSIRSTVAIAPRFVIVSPNRPSMAY